MVTAMKNGIIFFCYPPILEYHAILSLPIIHWLLSHLQGLFWLTGPFTTIFHPLFALWKLPSSIPYYFGDINCGGWTLAHCHVTPYCHFDYSYCAILKIQAFETQKTFNLNLCSLLRDSKLYTETFKLSIDSFFSFCFCINSPPLRQ